MSSDTELLERLYDRFNARDIEAALATMHPDVIWANGLEGGHVHGHDGVRDYWTRQWAMMDSCAEADPENPAAWINLAYAVRRTDSIEQAEAILLSPTSATGVRAEVSASGVAAILAKGRHYTSNFTSRARPAATPGLARVVEALHGADQNTKS